MSSNDQVEFDPSKPFDVPKVEFDPSKPFEPVKGSKERPGLLQTVADQGSAGVLGGFFDEASGLVSGAGRMAGIENLGGKFKDVRLSDDGPTLDYDKLSSAYAKTRDAVRGNLKAEHEDSPYISGASQFAGAIVSPLNKLIPAGASGLRAGATIGAIQGLGNSDADNLVDMGKDTALGLGLGGAFGHGADKIISPAIGWGATKVGNGLKDLAETKAFKSLGPYARDTMKAYSKDQINSTGRALLDNDVIGNVPTSYEGLATRAQAAVEKKGSDIDALLENLSRAQQNIESRYPGTSMGVDRSKIVQSLRDDLINPNTDIPGMAAKNSQVEKLIKQFEAGDDSLIPILQAEKLKRSVGKEINWDRLPGADIPLEEQVNRGLYTKLKTGVEDSATALDRSVNGDGSQNFVNLKNEYGALERGSQIAGKREAKEAANRMFSPSDYFMAAPAIAHGVSTGQVMPVIAGLGMGAANNLGRKYGNQVISKQADKVSEFLLNSPKMQELAQSSPAAFQQLTHAIGEKAGLFGGSLSGVPQKAAGNDQKKPQQASSQTLDMFSQNPDLINNVKNPELKQQIQKHLEKTKDPKESFVNGN